MTEIVFWQNMPSPHQAPLINALAKRGCAIDVVVDSPLPPWRQESGWAEPSWASSVRVLVQPERDERLSLLKARPRAAHVFSGLTAYPEIAWTFRQASARRLRCFAMLEPWDPRGASGAVRAARWTLRARRTRRRVDGVLAIGKLAERQYSPLFGADKVKPFGYYPDVPDQLPEEPNPSLEIIFVGRLIPLKGVDLLLRALAVTRGKSWRLTIVGDGPERAALKHLSHSLSLEQRVRWISTLPRADALELIARSDLLVLPSRYDGWGAVASEAALLGTRVICSPRVGASGTIANAGCCLTVETEPRPFARALENEMKRGPLSHIDRAERRVQADAHLSPEAGAIALERILKLAGP